MSQITNALSAAMQHHAPQSASYTTIWVAEIPAQGALLNFSPELAPFHAPAIPTHQQQVYVSPQQQPNDWPTLNGCVPPPSISPNTGQCLAPEHAAYAPSLAAAHPVCTPPQPQILQHQPYPLRFGNPHTIYGRPTTSRFIQEVHTYGGIVIYNGHINLPPHIQASQFLLDALSQQYLSTIQTYPQFNSQEHAWLIMNTPQGQTIWTPFIISEQFSQVVPATQQITAPPQGATPVQPNIHQFQQYAQQHQPAQHLAQSHNHFYISHFQGKSANRYVSNTFTDCAGSGTNSTFAPTFPNDSTTAGKYCRNPSPCQHCYGRSIAT